MVNDLAICIAQPDYYCAHCFKFVFKKHHSLPFFTCSCLIRHTCKPSMILFKVFVSVCAIYFQLVHYSEAKRRLPYPHSVTHHSIIENVDVEINTTHFIDIRRMLKASNSEVHRVKKLPGLHESSLFSPNYAGHLPVDEVKGGHIFYWFFEAPENASSLPILVWINGGPGCSSMDGLFLELGPFRLDGEKVKLNPYSWHKVANLLFIDQPVGTGLSFTQSADGYPRNDEAVNRHFFTFMQQFFKLHARFVSTVDGRQYSQKIFLSGESHAGHYIPSMAVYILAQNKKSVTVGDDAQHVILQLEGLALGNPWIDPFNQYDVSSFVHGLGLITQGQKNKLKEQERKCRELLLKDKFNNGVCFALLDSVIDASTVSGANKLLMYDARKFLQNTKSFPPGHEAVEVYLNKADVKEAIHAQASKQKFVECADPPYFALSHQDGKGVTKELAFLLDTGLRVLIYSGQYDIIVNHIGTEAALDQLEWTGSKDWRSVGVSPWIVNKRPAGYIRAFKNLQSLLVLDAGHMVPQDVPAIALTMISNFINRRPFSGGSFTPSRNKLAVSWNDYAVDGSHLLCPATVSTIPTRYRNTTTSSDSYQVRRRLETELSGIHNDIMVVISHTTPMNGAVMLRLKSVRHHKAVSVSDTSPENLRTFKLVIDPRHGNDILFDYDIHKPYVDLLVEGLEDGKDYSFMVTSSDTSTTGQQQPVADRHIIAPRKVVSRPGCFSEDITQCCGHGECTAGLAGQRSTACFCDQGYSGAHCDFYEVHAPAPVGWLGKTTGLINVSGRSSCPAHSGQTRSEMQGKVQLLRFHYSVLNETLNSEQKLLNSDLVESNLHFVCPNSGSGSGSLCHSSVGLVMDPGERYLKALNTAELIEAPLYKDAFEKLLMSDLYVSFDKKYALDFAAHGSSMMEAESLKIAISLGALQYRKQNGDTVVLNRGEHFSNEIAISNPRNAIQASGLVVTILLSGSASVVKSAIKDLASQMDDSESLLRHGFVSSTIRSEHILILSHKRYPRRSLRSLLQHLDCDASNYSSSQVLWCLSAILLVAVAGGIICALCLRNRDMRNNKFSKV